MQFTTVRSKEKDFDIFKVRKTSSKPVEAQQKCFPAIWKWKKLVPSYFEPENHCYSYLEREKSGILLFGDQKMQFTTVRSKEKDYDIYLKSEKLVDRQLEKEKNVSQLFGSGKNWSLAISSLTNTVAAIWREKKVDPCYLETKKCCPNCCELHFLVSKQQRSTFFSLQIAATVFVRLEITRNQFFPLSNSWETYFSCSYWL